MTTGEIGKLLGHQKKTGSFWPWGIPIDLPINALLGRFQCAQGSDPYTDPISGYLLNNAVNILPQVVQWPFGSDDDGCPFDISSIWGIKFSCHNPEVYDLIAVPKGLPSGYVLAAARSSWQAPMVAPAGASQFYSDDSGATWKTHNGAPTSYSWTRRAAPNLDNIAHHWGPMNYRTSCLGGDIPIDSNWLDYGNGIVHQDYLDPSFPTTLTDAVVMNGIASDHIGFRRVHVRATNGSSVYSYKMSVACVDVGVTIRPDNWSLPLGANEKKYPDGVTVLQTITVPASPVGTLPYNDYYFTALAPTLGKRQDFYLIFDNTANGLTTGGNAYPFGTLPGAVFVTLSPRVDVPLWFHVTGPQAGGSDWHAPGGYVP